MLTVEFTVVGIPCLGLNGGPALRHSDAFSFQIATDTQEETDHYWNAIVGNGGTESQCGWCRDRWGISWQITPRVLTDALAAGGSEAKRAFAAMNADEEDRHRHHRGRTARLMWTRNASLADVDVQKTIDEYIDAVRAAGAADSPARARDDCEGGAGCDRDDQLRHSSVQAPSYPRLFRGVQAPHRTVPAREGRCGAREGRRAVRRRERQPAVPHRAEDSVRVDRQNREVQGDAVSMNQARSVVPDHQGYAILQ